MDSWEHREQNWRRLRSVFRAWNYRWRYLAGLNTEAIEFELIGVLGSNTRKPVTSKKKPTPLLSSFRITAYEYSCSISSHWKLPRADVTLGGFSALQKGGDAAFCHRIMRTGKDHWAHPVQLSASPTMPINLIPQPWHTALSTSSTFRQKTAISALSSGPLPWCPPAPKQHRQLWDGHFSPRHGGSSCSVAQGMRLVLQKRTSCCRRTSTFEFLPSKSSPWTGTFRSAFINSEVWFCFQETLSVATIKKKKRKTAALAKFLIEENSNDSTSVLLITKSYTFVL